MGSEERIRRMLDEGLISADQAAALCSAVGLGQAPPPRSTRHPWRVPALAGGAVLLAVLLFAAAPGGGPASPPQDVAAQLNQPGGHAHMPRGVSAALAVALFAGLPIGLWAWLHNGLVNREEAVFEAWAQVESQFQRRADLIPALVETVSRYTRHEAATLAQTAEVRAARARELDAALDALAAPQAAVGAGRTLLEDQAALADLARREAALHQGVQRLYAVAEAYPQLRASDQFLTLQAQLEGTENRINTARMRFNAAVSRFNAALRRLPWSLVGSVGGFQRKAYFQADPGAEKALDLDFE